MANETEGFSSWATVGIVIACVAGRSPGSFISVTVFGVFVTAWVKATVKEVICY